MRIWRVVRHGLDRLLEGLVAVSMAVLVIDVAWQVFTRKVLNDPSERTEELATFLMIWVGLLGGSVALRRGAHLGIDYFVSLVAPRIRTAIEAFVFALIATFSIVVLGIGGIQLVRATLLLGQKSPALGIEMGLVYLALPVSAFFLTLYSVEFMIERIVKLLAKRPAEESPTAQS